jgi:DNA-directed RNA polymerase specialized sigma subunit
MNRLIHKAIGKLDYSDRELISELYFNHASVNKLSKKYGTTRSTIRYRRDKALKNLKEIVKKEMKS